MKKIIAMVLVTLMFGAIFTGCGKEKVCDFCEETYKGKSHSITYMGQKGDVCPECYEGYKELKEIYGQMFE